MRRVRTYVDLSEYHTDCMWIIAKYKGDTFTGLVRKVLSNWINRFRRDNPDVFEDKAINERTS